MVGRHKLAGLLFALLVMASVGAAAPVPRPWQDGEILSRKTVVSGRDYVHKQYVYRIKSFGRYYLVVSNTALHLDINAPMRFSADRRHLVIQDADGQKCKVAILQTARYPSRL